MRQSTKIHSTTRGFHAVLPCRAAVVVGDSRLCVRDHPPAPEVDRLAVAAAELRQAGPARARLPAQRRGVRGACRRVRRRHHDRLAVCGGDRRAAGGPGAEAARGGPGRRQGRACLRRGGRHPHSHRPGRRGPALLLRQAQEARHEPAGHRQPWRGHLVGVRAAARLGP